MISSSASNRPRPSRPCPTSPVWVIRSPRCTIFSCAMPPPEWRTSWPFEAMRPATNRTMTGQKTASAMPPIWWRSSGEFNESGAHPDPRGFGIGVAGFPEGHPATPNRVDRTGSPQGQGGRGCGLHLHPAFFRQPRFPGFPRPLSSRRDHGADHCRPDARHLVGGHEAHGGTRRRSPLPGKAPPRPESREFQRRGRRTHRHPLRRRAMRRACSTKAWTASTSTRSTRAARPARSITASASTRRSRDSPSALADRDPPPA